MLTSYCSDDPLVGREGDRGKGTLCRPRGLTVVPNKAYAYWARGAILELTVWFTLTHAYWARGAVLSCDLTRGSRET